MTLIYDAFPTRFYTHPIRSFVHVEYLPGARRGEKCWMPNLVKMAGGVTPSVLSRKSV
jgi:hypothetical protein